jgi:Holliday junction resolvasome RuvABC endonuclease subunit
MWTGARQMILALDQSLTNTGYIVAYKGKIHDSGIISTESQKKKRNIGDMDDKSRRTAYIIDQVKRLIKTHSIKAIICEEYAGFSQSKSAADALATSRTIVIAVSTLLEVPLCFVSAMDAKEALTNKRTASKDEMLEASLISYPNIMGTYKSAKAKNGFLGKGEHVADAIGIYLAGRKLTVMGFIEA